MTNASATGTYSSVSWSGGAGLGTWTQNANPALATFTPSVNVGSFAAMLTLTGTGACSGTNSTMYVLLHGAMQPLSMPVLTRVSVPWQMQPLPDQ